MFLIKEHTSLSKAIISGETQVLPLPMVRNRWVCTTFIVNHIDTRVFF